MAPSVLSLALLLLLPMACSESADELMDEALMQAMTLLQVSLKRPRSLQSEQSLGNAANGSAAFVEPLDDRDLELGQYYSNHEPSPPDCNDPHELDQQKPIREVLEKAKAANPEMDGSCYFQGMRSCSIAHRKRDFFEFSATWPSAFTGVIGRSTPSWRDAVMTTEPHVFVYDAEYCLASGWVDIDPQERERLLQNYSAIEEKTQAMCANYEDRIQNLSAVVGNSIFPRTDAEVARQAVLPPEQRPGFMDPETLAKHQAVHCAMGAADCMMHFCMWTFCRTSRGTIGMGQQCRSDWRLKPLDMHPTR